MDLTMKGKGKKTLFHRESGGQFAGDGNGVAERGERIFIFQNFYGAAY